MKQRTQRIIGYATLGYAAICAAVAASDIRLNLTDSAPIGIWTSRPIGSIERGTIAFWIFDGQRLLKPVSAIEGDTVQIKRGYPVTVNGKELPNTIARPKMKAWPDGEYTVKYGEVWVFSSYSDKSYDSRYFGPVGVSAIQGEAIPLLVLGNAAKVTGGTL